MRGRRRGAALTAVVLAAGMTGCSAALPESVVPGTKVVVGWTGEFTSTNAAASPTRGNVDIAAMTRARFGDVVDGEFVADPGFGTVEIVDEDPFTVRYDLAEPAWSDGIPLDAADLLLGWAGSSGWFPAEGGESASGAPGDADAAEQKAPVIDEFARAIDVTYGEPVYDWQSAVAAPVPAHVLGELAFGVDDPMQAKQAVITAIRTADRAAIEKMAAVWNTGFELGAGAVSDRLMLSSGPFRVESRGADAGGGVVLVPNAEFRGPVTPQVARIELTAQADDPLAAVGDAQDIVQVAPTAANQDAVRELERKDFAVSTTHDGTLWAMLLKPSGVFSSVQARTAFIHAVPQRDLIDAGGGPWRAAYPVSTSMVTAPGSRAFDIVNEDSGFRQRLGSTEGEPPLERAAAGVPAGTRICVLYDRKSAFAVGAFGALRTVAAEAGWNIVDCGSDDFAAALGKGGWNAVIARVPIPASPAQIAAQWGTGGSASITGQADPARDELITRLAHTADVYEARDLYAQIEATIVRAAVAVPLAANPVVTVVDRDVQGVTPRTGAAAPVTSGASQWVAAP